MLIYTHIHPKNGNLESSLSFRLSFSVITVFLYVRAIELKSGNRKTITLFLKAKIIFCYDIIYARKLACIERLRARRRRLRYNKNTLSNQSRVFFCRKQKKCIFLFQARILVIKLPNYGKSYITDSETRIPFFFCHFFF